jgi:hypothetical protein
MANLKAIFVPYVRKIGGFNKFMQPGIIVVQDADTEFPVIDGRAFDGRYTGKRSKLGKYLRDLAAKGVDVSSIVPTPLEKEQHELVIKLAQRLYDTLVVKRITIENKTKPHPVSSAHTVNYTTIVTRKADVFDWNSPGVRQSKYYRLAESLIRDNDPETVYRIVSTISDFA